MTDHESDLRFALIEECIRDLREIVASQQHLIHVMKGVLVECARNSVSARVQADGILDRLNKMGIADVDSDPSPTRRF